VSDFRRLKVWQKAHELTLMTYSVTKAFPREEMYALTSQMRRAAVSIGSNIAEGTGRDTRKEMMYFIRIASGSTHELQGQAMIGRDLGWIAPEQYHSFEATIAEVRAMLHALRRSLEGGARL
jgi:four helix bundle protein